jgi:putative drug exporter of the RND superfamily
VRGQHRVAWDTRYVKDKWGTMTAMSFTRLVLASARHPWHTIGAWVAAMLLAFVAIGALLGGALTTEGNPTNNPQSQRAKDVREAAFPAASSAAITDIVVVRSRRYMVDAPQFRALVRELAGEVRAAKDVESVRTYLVARDPSLVSRDRHVALVQFAMPDESSNGIDHVIGAVQRADMNPAFAVTVTGQRTVNHDFNKLSEDDLRSGELQFGLPAALVVLLLVFGTVVAGFVPLLIALPSIIVALSFVAVLGHAFSLSIFTINMLTGMGLALGIDYALFVVSRFREERGRGREKLDAIRASAMTASRAVLFSGTTFVIAMFGMFIVPSSIMRSLAVGAILVGIVSVVASATLLPALLGLLGDRVDRLRIPFVGRRSLEAANPEGRFWGAIVRSVLRRPVLAAGLSVALLLAAASPIFGMHIGTSGPTLLPMRFEARQGFAALHRYFPAATADPVEIIVAKGAKEPAAEQDLARLRASLASDPGFGPGQIERSPNGKVTMLLVPVRGDPSGDAAVSAVRHLRSTTVPAAFENTDARVLVGGTTSENIDYFDSVIRPAPWVIAFVLALTLVFLTVVFRSLVVAATAVVLNLLSVGAAYGLLVLVFQHGFASGLLGFHHVDTIEAWVPLFLFSVLFGLSMDYQVFLLSRIRERYDETLDTTDAVTFGVASTARIITGAALIIVAVFAGFAAGELVMFQQMGFGVAIALLIDATIIRSVLLPATMHLLGGWNWYLPHWLDWLPRLQVESPAPRAAQQEA